MNGPSKSIIIVQKMSGLCYKHVRLYMRTPIELQINARKISSSIYAGIYECTAFITLGLELYRLKKFK